MNSFLDLAYQVLTSPAAAMRSVTAGERLLPAGVLWIFVVFATSLSSWLEGPGFITVFLFCLLAMGVSLFLHSAVISYCAGLLGGYGTARGLTAGFMAASLPCAFSVFGAALSMAAGSGAESILGAAAVLWSFYLDVLAIRENYRFSSGKALTIALVPWMLAGLALIALLFLGAAAAITGLAGMESLGGMVQEL